MSIHKYANPNKFLRLSGPVVPWAAGLTAVLLAVGLYLTFFASPPDYQQGETVRIMYIHVPAAWMAMFCYTAMAISCAVGLIWKHPLADFSAKAIAPIGAAFTLLALITGSLWGKPMWGTYWVWDARLTSVLVLFFLYLGYMALVNAFDDPTRGFRAAGILGVIGIIMVPIIKFSVDWWNTLHQPASVGWIENTFGAAFHDFAGSIVVHAVGGWIALGAVVMLGARMGRYKKDGSVIGIPPSNIPFLALGSWILCVGWFGFNVMSAQSLDGVTGLVAVNSLMAMIGGILTALIVGRNDPGFIHNGALAGLVAVCAGSDVMHPVGALATGGIAGALFVWGFEQCQNKWKIDDVLGVWPLHGMCGLMGGIACGIFGLEALGGMGGVTFMAQLVGSLIGVAFAAIAGFVVYGVLAKTVGIRLEQEEEFRGADLSIHQIGAYPEEDLTQSGR